MKHTRQYRGGYQVAGRAALARDLRKSQTSAEDLLWQLLRGRRLLGFKFRRQHQFRDYIADFFCREAGLVIECDGNVHDENESWYQRRTRDAYMISQGLWVLRFTNQQILTNMDKVLEEAREHLSSHIARDGKEERWAERTKPSPQPSPRGRGR